MTELRTLLREADPLECDPVFPPDRRDSIRDAILSVPARVRDPERAISRRLAIAGAAALAVFAASLAGPRMGALFVRDLAAAIRFEVRLAEDQPAPGLREAKVAGSNRSVYLYDSVIVSNGDIASAHAVPGSGPSDYSVNIEFNAAGAARMHDATASHVGKLIAILLDGGVVMAPTLRSPISESARITGHFTKPQAERIANGLAGR
jgi:preprotein translocase subunit SecD